MTGIGFAFHRIEWAEGKDGELPTRLLLLKDGDIGWADLEDVKLDEEQADAIIAAFEKQGSDIPIDMHHATVKLEEHPERVTQGGTAPAVGWIKGLDYVEGEGLYADPVEWTDADAMRDILGKRYKYFSPVIITDKETNEIVALHSVALTNKPRTKAQKELLEAAEHWSARQENVGMNKYEKLKAVTLNLAKSLRIEVGQEDEVTEVPEFPAVDGATQQITKLLKLLQDKGAELEDDATLQAVIEAAIVMIEAADEEEKPTEEAPTEEEAATQEAAKTIAAELGVATGDHKKLVSVLASLKVKAARHDDLDKRIAELEGDRSALRVKTLMGQQIEVGKLNPHDEKMMDSARKLAASDEQGFRNLFDGMSTIIEPGQQVTEHGGKRGMLIAEAGREYDADPKVALGATKASYVSAALSDETMAKLTDDERETLKGGE